MATNLNKAKKAKNDEFYTLYSDVAKELRHYKKHFKGKKVFCNCDNPTRSAFWKYFHLNFEVLGLKKLISTHYDNDKATYKMVYKGGNDNNIEAGVKTPLQGNGDFRNKECIELLKKSDIVVTNPPFSLFREYVATLMEYKKKFLIIGNMNAVTYKEIFPLIKNNQIWYGVSLSGSKCSFIVPDSYEGKNVFFEDGVKKARINNAIWLTNLDHHKRHEKIVLCKKYIPEEFPKYDNYNAIDCSLVRNIPCDYDGVVGVPITFLAKYNPEQFEIVGWSRHNDLNMDGGYWKKGTCNDALIGGKLVYRRILIRKKVYRRILIRKNSK